MIGSTQSPELDNYEENKKIFSPPQTKERTLFRNIKYEFSWKLYALGYSWRPNIPFRFGAGSFLEGKENKVRLGINRRWKY